MGVVSSIAEFTVFRQARSDLRYWRRHLQLAYERDWDERCTATAKREIDRLRAIVEPETICDKIAAEHRR
jgi:hypothetical protein